MKKEILSFNVYEEANVSIGFPNDKSIKKEDTIGLYFDIRKNGKVMFNKKNYKRRVVILQYYEKYYLVSTIGNKKYNEILLFLIEEEKIEEEIKRITEVFKLEEKNENNIPS